MLHHVTGFNVHAYECCRHCQSIHVNWGWLNQKQLGGWMRKCMKLPTRTQFVGSLEFIVIPVYLWAILIFACSFTCDFAASRTFPPAPREVLLLAAECNLMRWRTAKGMVDEKRWDEFVQHVRRGMEKVGIKSTKEAWPQMKWLREARQLEYQRLDYWRSSKIIQGEPFPSWSICRWPIDQRPVRTVKAGTVELAVAVSEHSRWSCSRWASNDEVEKSPWDEARFTRSLAVFNDLNVRRTSMKISMN